MGKVAYFSCFYNRLRGWDRSALDGLDRHNRMVSRPGHVVLVCPFDHRTVRGSIGDLRLQCISGLLAALELRADDLVFGFQAI